MQSPPEWLAWAVYGGTGALVGVVFMAALAAFIARLRPARRTEDEMRTALMRLVVQDVPQDPSVLGGLRRDPDRVRAVLASLAAGLQGESAARVQKLWNALGFPQELERDLRSPAWHRRARAAKEAGLVRATDAIRRLLVLLQDPEPEVRSAALHALCAIGPPVPLAPLLQAIYATGHWAACRVNLLSKFASTAAAEALAALQRPPSRPALLVAVEMLGLMRVREAVPLLRRLIESPDLEDRVRCARALGRIGDPAAYPEVLRAMTDPVWQVRAAAATALGELKLAQAADVLERSLSDPAWWVRHNSAKALAMLGPEGSARLARSLGQSDAFARDMAAQMLDELKFRGKPA